MTTLAELGILTGGNGLFDYGVGRAFGEDNGRALTGALGSTIGMTAGGFTAGLPGLVAGHLLGGWTADRIGDALAPKQVPVPQDKAISMLNQHLQRIPTQ